MNFTNIKSRFDEHRYASLRALYPEPPVRVKGVIIGILDQACGGKENRYLLSVQLTGAASSKEWSISDWYAIERFVRPEKDELTGKWVSATPDFDRMVGIILTHAVEQDGQMRFQTGQEEQLRMG